MRKLSVMAIIGRLSPCAFKDPPNCDGNRPCNGSPLETGSASLAADWPTRTVHLIVPFPPGSANNSAARLYAEGLSKRWGKPVVIENKPGADASIGTGVFANARDDHTLLTVLPRPLR